MVGLPVVERFALATSGGMLRILAYHGIPDPARFALHLDHLVNRYRPVGSEQVIKAFAGGAHLPRRAVWVTFDDGCPEVVQEGLPLLAERGIPATLFVCPGVVDTCEPFWWDVVAVAAAHGIRDDAIAEDGPLVASSYKSLPDAQRRDRIAALATRLQARGVDLATCQITSDELRRWHDAGMDVGNHTWDHPLLDRCDESTQRAQIEQAHDALCALTSAPTTFAYPNGNVTTTARDCVARLGYGAAVDFAHRLCSPADDALALPRLRVDADAPLARFRAIVGGTHPAVFAVVGLARRTERPSLTAAP